MLGRPRPSSIGVSISATRVHAAQLRVVRRGATIHRRLSMGRLNPGGEFDAAEAARLAATLERQGFVGNTCVVALPNEQLIRALVEVSGKADDVVLTAAEEVERTHMLTPGSYELAAWLPAGAVGRRTTAVCVNGCLHKDAQHWLETFDRAGLDVVALDSRACAISRVMDESDAAAHVTAVIDLDDAGGELVMLSGGQVLYQRPLLDIGLGQAARRLIDAGLDATTAEHFLTRHGLGETDGTERHDRLRKLLLHYTRQLVAEAQPGFDYVTRLFTGQPIERFALVGDASRVPVLSYELRQQLRLARATFAPLGLRLTEDEDPAFAAAIGLTLHPQEATWAAA